MEKMRMTETLANTLLDDLACLWISATDAVIEDRNGEPTLTISDEEAMEKWVKATFAELADYWEEKTGKKWEVVSE